VSTPHTERVAGLPRVIVPLLALTALPAQVAAAEPGLALKATASRVGRYEKIEFAIQGVPQYARPFDPQEVDLSLVLQTPSGPLRVPAFFCQDYERRNLSQGNRQAAWMYPVGMASWKARFAPLEVGAYEAVAELQDKNGRRTSPPVRFACEPSANPGFVRISTQDPRYLEFSAGRQGRSQRGAAAPGRNQPEIAANQAVTDAGMPFYPLGQNLAFIGETQYMNLNKAEASFAKLAANGANYLRIWACCEDWAMAIEARKSAWGRSWGWKPPFASGPPAGGAGSDRKYIRLGGERSSVDVSPSHNVALRPGTRYRLTARVLLEGEARLQVAVGSHSLKQPVTGNAGRWQPWELNFETGPGEHWLGRTALRREGSGTAWVDALSLTEADGGPELLWEADANRPPRGFYNPVDCFMLDQVLAAAEKHGLYLRLCLITRDLYMKDLKKDSSPEYQQAIEDAKKLLRYAVARWGYSTHIATWEYFNEIDPGLPTDRFYRELGQYLEQIDVYRHLRSTSTWNYSIKDLRHPQLDVADVHFYFRAVKDQKYQDEVHAAQGNTDFLREHAPNKPALIGEYGLANEKWQPTKEMNESRDVLDFHNSLWASSLAGASGAASFWWWDRLDRCDAYPLYRPVAEFLKDIPWTTAKLHKTDATVSGPRLRLVGLQGTDRAYLWLFDPAASWQHIVIDRTEPSPVRNATVELRGLADREYRVQWFDTRKGQVLRETPLRISGGTGQLAVPEFVRDIACRIVP
jgi:hypothetical protein